MTGADPFAAAGAPDVRTATLTINLTPRRDRAGVSKQVIEGQLREALGKGELFVVYQPLVPAEWGGITDRVAEGSLDFVVGLAVTQIFDNAPRASNERPGRRRVGQASAHVRELEMTPTTETSHKNHVFRLAISVYKALQKKHQ